MAHCVMSFRELDVVAGRHVRVLCLALQVVVTVNLIKKAMAKSGGSKFLIDGFPRNFDNLEGWHEVVGESADVKGVLMYECPEEVMEARLMERGKTSGRSDDNIDVIRKR